MKISIVMTYFNRQFQLSKTLQSISKSKHDNFEVIIVDDSSTEKPIIPKVKYPVCVITTKNKSWTNPEPAYNTGIIQALKSNPDIIIVQNAECIHYGDIINYSERITDETYFSFACFSINKESTFSGNYFINETMALSDGDNAWYNHPIYRPVGYDFCAAITSRNMMALNGYDERFSHGVGRGDNYLLHRIKLLGLRIEMPVDPFVIHQWHYTPENTSYRTQELLTRNFELYDSIIQEQRIKAVHLITPDFESIVN